MSLHVVGWNPFFQEHWESKPRLNFKPARIVEEQREAYRVVCEVGELPAEITGRFRHGVVDRAAFPAVGDWVAIETITGERKASIHEVLPRRTKLSRKAAGEQAIEQVLVANVDIVLIVTSANDDLNPRRLERYVNMVLDSGARPVIVLSKSDLSADSLEVGTELRAVAPGTEVLVLSAATGDGLDQLNPYIGAGSTVVLVGSSGVGKSTIINALLGDDVQTTIPIRSGDGRGRHATTYRRLFAMPTGGVLIDTPGIRELQLWEPGHIEDTFDDVVALAQDCRFRDCRHAAEPGCAVQKAIAAGDLDAERLDHLNKLKSETEDLDRRRDLLAQSEERKVRKQRSKGLKQPPNE